MDFYWARSINRGGFLRSPPLKIGVLTEMVFLMVTASVNGFWEAVFIIVSVNKK